jgi:hypothetical protein
MCGVLTTSDYLLGQWIWIDEHASALASNYQTSHAPPRIVFVPACNSAASVVLANIVAYESRHNVLNGNTLYSNCTEEQIDDATLEPGVAELDIDNDDGLDRATEYACTVSLVALSTRPSFNNAAARHRYAFRLVLFSAMALVASDTAEP